MNVSSVTITGTSRTLILFAAMLACAPRADAASNQVAVVTEATIRGGAYADHDFDEVVTNYLHVKYDGSPFSNSRKTYFRFELAGTSPDSNAPATFGVTLSAGNAQHVQLWALNQPYPGFSSTVTWNDAQANQTNGNQLLTGGTFTAVNVGADRLIPGVNGSVAEFTIPRLGDVIRGEAVVLALAGVYDTNNNAGGLRLKRGSAFLRWGTSETNSAVVEARDYDVYLAAGQSNMDGRGYTTNLMGTNAVLAGPQTGIPIFYCNPISKDAMAPTYWTGWQTLAPGFAVPPGFAGALPSDRFGPELPFARATAETRASRRVAIIKVSQGGTSLNTDWAPGTGFLYTALTNTVRLALAELVARGAHPTVRGMIWHQGESDSSGTAATDYATNLKAFIVSVRRDLGISNLPVVIGELATNKSAVVRGAQRQVAEDLPWVGFAHADGLNTIDGTHFDTLGVIELGRRMATAWETPPAWFTSVTRSEGNLVLHAEGLARGQCRLLTSSSPGTPLGQWSPTATNSFDSTGRVSFLVGVDPGLQARFFHLQPL